MQVRMTHDELLQACREWASKHHGLKVSGDPVRKELDSDTLFPNEDVTKGPTYIHAWGKEKLIEYLIKLSKAAGIRVKDRGT